MKQEYNINKIYESNQLSVDDVFNETVLGILDDYVDLLGYSLRDMYNVSDNAKPTSLTTIYAILECDLEVTKKALAPYPKEYQNYVKINTIRAEILHSNDFNLVKNDEPFKSILSGKICRLPKGDNEIKEIITKARNIMLPKLKKSVLDEIDPTGEKMKDAFKKTKFHLLLQKNNKSSSCNLI